LTPKRSINPGVLRDVRSDEIDAFREYRVLSAKALHDAGELTQVRALLSNLGLIRQAYVDLLDTNSQDEIRFERLDYFEKAIAWAENPAREEIIDALRKILLNDNFLKLDDFEQRKSVVGDKIEIYSILKQFAPAALQEVAELSKDARIDKVITYAQNIHNSYRIDMTL
jgi:hypothetical protein